jgi:hypothetical protein
VTGEESGTCFTVPCPPFREIRFDGFDQAVDMVAQIILDHGLGEFVEDGSGNWVRGTSHQEAAKAIVLALFPELA